MAASIMVIPSSITRTTPRSITGSILRAQAQMGNPSGAQTPERRSPPDLLALASVGVGQTRIDQQGGMTLAQTSAISP